MLAAYNNIADPLEFVQKLGLSIAKSGMFGCENAEQGHVLAMACLCERKNPIEIARRYNIIQGNLSMKADAMLADFHGLGGNHTIVQRTEHVATIQLSIDGESERFSFSFEEAKQEPFVFGKKGQLKTNWATPRLRMQMLWARVVSDGVRAIRPEIVAGVYTPEEVNDFAGVNESAATKPATDATVKQATEAAQPVEEATVVESEVVETETVATDAEPSNGYADRVLCAQIKSLFNLVGVPQEKQEEILRRHKVSALRSLTTEDAKTLRDKLAAMGRKIAEKQKAQQATTEQATIQPEAEEAVADHISEQGHEGSMKAPCTSEQWEEIQRLVAEIEKADKDIVARLREKLGIAVGHSIRVQLNVKTAAKLINALTLNATGVRLEEPPKQSEIPF